MLSVIEFLLGLLGIILIACLCFIFVVCLLLLIAGCGIIVRNLWSERKAIFLGKFDDEEYDYEF